VMIRSDERIDRGDKLYQNNLIEKWEGYVVGTNKLKVRGLY
jgi:hypothetical protein